MTSPRGYPQARWTLKALLASHEAAAVDAAIESVQASLQAFEPWRTRLNAGISDGNFLAVLHEYEAILVQMRKLESYAGLWFSEDTQNPTAMAFMGRTDQLGAEVNNRTLFFSLWWKGLDDETAARLMVAAGPYAYFLEQLRHFKPFTLSEPEEKVITLKDVNGRNAVTTLYDMVTNRYVFELQVDGERKRLTRGELAVYIRHPDPALREAAYREMYRVYGQDGTLLGQMYHYIVRDWRNENVQLRGFATPIAVRNLGNDVPDAVVETLLDVCRANASLFQRYFRLKARALGIPKLRRYDVYAPLARSEREYPYEQGVGMVLDSLRDFSPRVAELAQRVFSDGHIDSAVRPGKRSGAFCAGILPGLTPYVLVNYQARVDDLATLAHELGHAVHALLADAHTALTFHSSLPLAETASTFMEMVLIDRLLKDDPDPAVRRQLLFRQLDDHYATIMRQAFFALFEREAHELVQRGESVDVLAERYLGNLRDQFGDSLELSDEFRWEWISIPHIYNYPFYVYAYAFGQLLVLALYQQYRAEGEAFKPRFLEILAAGGSDAPARILTAAGIDMTQRSFWQGGFDVVARMVDELEGL